MMNSASELRHLPPLERRNLVQLLDHGDSWITLAAKIARPVSASGSGAFLITNEHMKILHPLKHHPSTSPSDALIEFWSTCGRKHERPTLASLLDLAVECNLTRLAAYVSSLIGIPYCDVDDADDHHQDQGASQLGTFYSDALNSSSFQLNTTSINSSGNHSTLTSAGQFEKVSPLRVTANLLLPDDSPVSADSATKQGGQFTTNFNCLSPPFNENKVSNDSSAIDGQNNNSNLTEESICSKLRQLGLHSTPLDTPIIAYATLKNVTGNFAPLALHSGGLMIGAGAYGTVFKATLTQQQLQQHNLMLNHEHCSAECCLRTHPANNAPREQVSRQLTESAGIQVSAHLSSESANSSVTLAVKLLAENVDTKQFINEVAVLTKFKHDNLLPFLGISIDGPQLCLLYQFMPLGSLTRVLARTPKVQLQMAPSVVSARDRVNIAIGTAAGLVYLHTFDRVPYVHRDVKSDNILLDQKLTPKLGDFGLVRIGSTASSSSATTSTKTSLVTQNVIGTTVYMAPEAFRGDVSTALDAFAFGIVLLELVTGLPAFDSTREEVDILSHVDDLLEDWDFQSEVDCESISSESADAIRGLLDDRVDWTEHLNIAIGLLRIAKLLTEQRKKHRLSVVKALDLLKQL